MRNAPVKSAECLSVTIVNPAFCNELEPRARHPVNVNDSYYPRLRVRPGVPRRITYRGENPSLSVARAGLPGSSTSSQVKERAGEGG